MVATLCSLSSIWLLKVALMTEGSSQLDLGGFHRCNKSQGQTGGEGGGGAEHAASAKAAAAK